MNDTTTCPSDLSQWRGRMKQWPAAIDEFEEIPSLPQFVRSAYENDMLIPSSLLSTFPPPTLSISDFLKFKLPRLSAASSPSDAPSFSLLPPNIQAADIANLAKTDGPSVMTISHLDTITGQKWLDGCDSLEWEGKCWPLWVVTYWTLIQSVKQEYWAWKDGVTWVRDRLSSVRMEDVEYVNLRTTAERTLNSLGKVAWSGNTAGFGLQRTSIASLSTFLSSRWLTSIHLSIQAKLIQLKLDERDGLSRAAVEGTEVSTCIRRAYEARKKESYTSLYHSSSKFPAKRMGLRLEQGEIDELGCAVFVKDSHWIAAVINFPRRTISFGDSLGQLIPQDVVAAFHWWTQQHSTLSSPFTVTTLKCTDQRDTFSCGLLTANTLSHYFLDTPLLSPRLLTFGRMEALVNIFDWHIDSDVENNLLDPYKDLFSSTAFIPDASSDCGAPVAAALDGPNFRLGAVLASHPTPDTAIPPSNKPPSPQPKSSIAQLLAKTSKSIITEVSGSKPGVSANVKPTTARSSTATTATATTSTATTSTTPPTKPHKPSVAVLWATNTHRDAPAKPAPKAFNMKTAVQSTLKLVKLTPAEKEEIRQAEKERYEQVKAATAAADAIREAEELEAKRAGARERKRKSRAAQKAKKQADATTAPDLSLGLRGDSQSGKSTKEVSNEVALLTQRRLQPKTEKHRDKIEEKGTTSRRNMSYGNPLVWRHIAIAQSRVGWNPNRIADYIKKYDTEGFFGRVKGSLVRRWIDPVTKNQWTPEALKRVEKWGQAGSVGRSKIMTKYPALLEGIRGHLMGLREAGMPISVPMARAIIIGHIQLRQPDLLTTGGFKVASSWVRNFLTKELNWSFRKSTRANRKRPINWDDECVRVFFRFVALIQTKNITHPDLIVNFDHAGVSLVPLSEMTWAEKGSKQVDLQAKGEKRQMTLVVGSTPAGTVLPFQSIWGGDTATSLPSKSAHRRKEADEIGMKFTHGDTRHWASLQTSKEYVDQIFRVHIDRVIKENNLPEDSWSILNLDCWPVHIASGPDSFLEWLRHNHPRTIPLFCPAGCTGDFQPADVGLQRWNKHLIRQAATDFFAVYTSDQLTKGTPPSKISFPIGMPLLRDASVSWQLDALHGLRSKPDLVKKAWERCEAKGWNLSWECLTSARARMGLLEYIQANPGFANELGATVLPLLEGFEKGEANDSFNDDPADGEDVELDERVVIRGVTEDDAVIDDDDFNADLHPGAPNPEPLHDLDGDISMANSSEDEEDSEEGDNAGEDEWDDDLDGEEWGEMSEWESAWVEPPSSSSPTSFRPGSTPEGDMTTDYFEADVMRLSSPLADSSIIAPSFPTLPPDIADDVSMCIDGSDSKIDQADLHHSPAIATTGESEDSTGSQNAIADESGPSQVPTGVFPLNFTRSGDIHPLATNVPAKTKRARKDISINEGNDDIQQQKAKKPRKSAQPKGSTGSTPQPPRTTSKSKARPAQKGKKKMSNKSVTLDDYLESEDEGWDEATEDPEEPETLESLPALRSRRTRALKPVTHFGSK